MDELRNTKKLVHETLLNSKRARNSDNYLYYIICKAKLAAKGIDIDSISFQDGLINRNDYGLPAFETCRRARQRLQAQFPELAGTEEVESYRAIREEAFREFAKS